MITKPFESAQTKNPSRSWNSAASVGLGLITVAWPLAWAPAWAYPVAIAGAAAGVASALTGWRQGPALAVAAAIAAAALSHAGAPVLAAEGVLILAYLIAVSAPPGLTQPAQWLRAQVRLAVAGLIASGAVVAVLALHRPNAAWLSLAGLAAAVAAYVVALPRRSR
jgi:hypothetical protein